MCWLCEHPSSTREDYRAHMRDTIARCGWAVQGVARDRARPPWAYTVGLTSHGKPELVVTGMPVEHAGWLLNEVASYSLENAFPRPGETIDIEDGPVMEVVQVAEPTVHLLTAVDMYGPGIRALQLVHADDRGHWPWSAGYRGMRGGQPVLGTRATLPPTPASVA